MSPRSPEDRRREPIADEERRPLVLEGIVGRVGHWLGGATVLTVTPRWDRSVRRPTPSRAQVPLNWTSSKTSVGAR